MEINDNKITFELDTKTIDTFRLCLSLLELEGEDAFKKCVTVLAHRALRSSIPMSENDSLTGPFPIRSSLADKIDNEIVQSRIQRWARNKTSIPYKLLQIYFECYDKNEKHIVKRSQMEQLYDERYGNPSDDEKVMKPFILNFRLMCSDSSRAYGSIFRYNNLNGEDEVTLSPINAELIVSLRAEF